MRQIYTMGLSLVLVFFSVHLSFADSNSLTLNDTTNSCTLSNFIEPLPQDTTVECTDIPDPAVLTAIDSCGNNVNVNFKETNNDDGSCADYTIVREWSACGPSGNVIKHTQTITVRDTVAPYFIQDLPGDLTLECIDTVPEAATLTAADACDPSVCVVRYEEEITGQDDGCASDYLITRTWKVSDCAGNENVHVQTLTIEDNEAPEFQQDLPQSYTLDCTADIPDPEILTARDSCDSSVCVVNFNEIIIGKDDGCDAEYKLKRIWETTDCTGNENQHIQIITIEDNMPPTFVQPLPTDATFQCDANVPDIPIITAVDSCDSSVCVVDFNEVITGKDDDCPATFQIVRTWTTKDCADNSVSHTQTLTFEDTTPPKFVESLPVDLEVSCTDIPNATVLTATDNCDVNLADVTFEETISNKDDECDTDYMIKRVWKVADCATNEIMHTQRITVTGGDPAFVESLPADIEVSCESIPTAQTLTALDGCGNMLTVNFQETSTADDTTCGDYTITRTWKTDVCADTDITHTQIITVEPANSASFSESLPSDEAIECTNPSAPTTLTAVDACGNAINVVFKETSDKVDGCTSYMLTRTWTATYCGDEVLSHVQTINVTSGQTTFVEELPADETIECGDPNTAATLTAADGCGNPIDVTFEETSDQDENNDCPLYLITRTWTAIDCDGSEISHTQIISVGDTVAPTVVETIENLELLCGQDVPPVPDLTFNDNCNVSENLVVDFNEDEQTDNDGTITITRTWNVNDTCDNASSFTQVITITEPETNAQTIENCADDGVLDFTTLFQDTLAGTWEDLDSSGALSGNMFDTSGVTDGNYRFRLIDDVTNCTTGKEVTVIINSKPCEVLPCRLEDIEISEVVTPNGDGINEFFVVDGVEGCGFVIQVTIFNRLGQLVYESDDYQNDWAGIELGNDQLPSGTYFYIVKLVNSGFNDIQGFIFLGSGV